MFPGPRSPPRSTDSTNTHIYPRVMAPASRPKNKPRLAYRPAENRPNTNPQSDDNIALPVGICFNFHRFGHCNYGDRCRYRHVRGSAVGGPTNGGIHRPLPANSGNSGVRGGGEDTRTKLGRFPTQNPTNPQSSGKDPIVRRFQGEITPRRFGKVALEVPTAELARLSVVPTLNPSAPTSIMKIMGEGSVSVTFGSGVDITHLVIVTSSSSTIILKNLPLGISATGITELIRTLTNGEHRVPAQCINLEQDNSSSQASIRLRTPAEAVDIIPKLDKQIHGEEVLECDLLDSASTRTDNVVLFCHWFLPTCMAYVRFPGPCPEQNTASSLRINGAQVHPRPLAAKAFRGVIQYSIQVFDLPANTTELDIRLAYPEASHIELKAPRYREPQYQVVAMIQSLFERHAGGKVEFKVVSRSSDKRQAAVVKFDDVTMAEELFGELKNEKLECLGGDSLQMRINFTAKLRIDYPTYTRIADAVKKLGSKELRLKIWSQDKRPACIDLSGSNRDVVAKAKSTILKLMRGSLVQDENGQALWDPVLNFSDARQPLVAAAAKSNVHLSIDARNRTVTIYGSPEACQAARESLITAYGNLLESRLQLFPLYLDHEMEGSESQQHAIDECVDSILQRHNRNRVTITKEASRTKIIVRCTRADFPTLNTIQRIFKHCTSNQAPNSATNCVACFCDAEDPVITTCGHRYCSSCFQNLVRSVLDTRKFPILCFAPSDPDKTESSSATCDTPFDLSLIQRIMSTTELDSLLEVALTSYVQARPETFYYCPTPDCNTIFPAAAEVEANTPPKTRTCAQCFITSCLSCRTNSHVGKSCAENKLTDDDKARLWKEKSNTKDCPKCGAWTEKNNGCNHMTCTVCRGHWCWICGTEQDEATIYSQHMPNCTGPPPVAAAPRGVPGPIDPAALIDHLRDLDPQREMAALRFRYDEANRRQAERVRLEEANRRQAEENRLWTIEVRRRAEARMRAEERARAQRAEEEKGSGWGCSIM